MSISYGQLLLTFAAFLFAMFVMSFMQTNAVADVSQEAPASMPVKEITIFKDGHAFVLHEGEMPTDADLTFDTQDHTADQIAASILDAIKTRSLLV